MCMFRAKAAGKDMDLRTMDPERCLLSLTEVNGLTT